MTVLEYFIDVAKRLAGTAESLYLFRGLLAGIFVFYSVFIRIFIRKKKRKFKKKKEKRGGTRIFIRDAFILSHFGKMCMVGTAYIYIYML